MFRTWGAKPKQRRPPPGEASPHGMLGSGLNRRSGLQECSDGLLDALKDRGPINPDP